MNNFDYYVPIDVHGPIKTTSKVNIQKHSTHNPTIMFQLFDGCRPLMLDDISKVAIAFTNTEGVVTRGSGTLQVVNPHRGTISYELVASDITMFGLNTVTLGITTGNSFFTVQTTFMCQEISDDLYNALMDDGSGSGGSGIQIWTYGDDFPCQYFNIYCRLCRRCKWVWYNNTLPKPLCFEEVKMCKNPFVVPPVKNLALLPEYEAVDYPVAALSDGLIKVAINGTEYTCDIGKDGAIYLADKTLETPTTMIGLYLGPKMKTYYKKSERVADDNFDVDSLFDNDDGKE